MKAIYHSKYGSPSNLRLLDIDKPTPKNNEVLIRNLASSINSFDWDIMTGRTYIYRLMFGLTKPKINFMGCDVAGVIESVGSDITQFKVGDEVFGDLSQHNFNGFTEYVCAPEKFIAKKPENASFTQAAAIPQGGILALQSLKLFKDIKPHHTILINGAGGSVGPFALQMAKLHGATVTCVDSEIKLDMLRSLGADHVIDYKKEDFTKNGQQYDLIIEPMIKRSVIRYTKSLKPNGRLVVVGGKVGLILQMFFIGSILSILTSKKYGLLIHRPNADDLQFLKDLFEQGKIKSIIEKTYPLEDVALALQHYGDGLAIGKLVVKIADK